MGIGWRNGLAITQSLNGAGIRLYMAKDDLKSGLSMKTMVRLMLKMCIVLFHGTFVNVQAIGGINTFGSGGYL